jgi:hypothetical protein
MFWETVTQLLENIPNIEMHRFESEQALEDVLRRDEPQVLLLEEAKPQRNLDFERYYRIHPGLAIIVLDSGGIDTIVRLRDLGRDLLVRLVHALATDQEAESNSDERRLHVVSAADVKKLAVRQKSPKATVAAHYRDTREHIEDIRRWIDVCLHQCLMAEETATEGASIPGWAMSQERARSLLGSAYMTEDEEVLRRERQRLEVEIARRAAASRSEGARPRFAALAEAFDLNKTDQEILALTLAPELDGRYARVFGFLNDDLTRRRPTPSLLKQVLLSEDQLAWDVRQMLAGEGVLSEFRLLTADRNDPAPASEVGLVVAPEIVAYLLAEPGHMPDYGAHLELVKAHEMENNSSDQATGSLLKRLDLWRAPTDTDESPPIMQLVGGEATLDWFKRVASAAGDPVVLFHVPALSERELDQFIDKAIGAARVAVIHDAVLLVTGLAELQAIERERIESVLINELCRVKRLVIHGHLPWLMPGINTVWQVERMMPTIGDRAAMWRARAQAYGAELSESDSRALAASVRFDEPEIDATLRISCGESHDVDSFSLLQAAARRVARRVVPNAVRRPEAIFTWDDIVLPEPVLSQLQSIPSHVRHAGEVLEDWNYRSRMPYGQGVTALFSGASGTGKTMAAQILAADLNVELFQVDLAKTVSKYIGETEKNLDIVFDAAEKASAVLLFDEADALFGKRTEVRDAHDRYANVEVAYLLQRMEAYSGLAVLTTNFRQNLDTAFMRRLRFVIDFPAPNAKEREGIWERVFPSDAPLAEDVSFSFLARRLELAGGNIQQIALRAAFAAVAEEKVIEMRHIILAACEELHKLGMNNAERSLAELAVCA